MMKHLLCKACLSIILLVYSFTATAQSGSLKIDSLKKVLLTEREDTNKVNTLDTLAYLYMRKQDADSSVGYAKQALPLSQKLSFKKGQGYAFFIFADYTLIKKDYQQSLKDCYTAINFFKEAGFYRGIISVYYPMEISYFMMGNLPEANTICYELIKYWDKTGNGKEKAFVQMWLGFNYYVQEAYEQALTTYSDALETFKQTGSSSGSGQCYIYTANIYRIQKRYVEALHYDSVGLRIATADSDKQMTGIAYQCFGDILAQQADSVTFHNKNDNQSAAYTSALSNYIKSLDYAREVPDSGGMGDSYEHIAGMYIKLHQFIKAQQYADSALLMAKTINSNDNFEKSYLVQSRLDSVTGNYKNALDSYKKYVRFRDSIVNNKNTQKTTQIQMQDDFDKKESAAKAAQAKKDEEEKRIKNQQYYTIASLGTLVMAVVIIAFIQFKNSKQKQKANVLLERQKQKVESTLSDLKSTQAQLIQSEKMASLGELTAGIAHEIQNPLNFVNNFSEVNNELVDEINNETDIDEIKAIANDIKQNSEKILFHGKRADAIVKGMLQHSRQTKGVKESTDINALCDEYLRLSYHGLRAKDKSFNADFTTDFDDSIGKISIVPQDMGRVILNLFNNAFYAVNDRKKQSDISFQPSVSVQTRKANNNVEIIVKDNGSGIPQHIIDKIFQPFFTTKPTGQGTGLGLSMSYDIITKEHSGTIKAESQQNSYTRFIITLPI